MPGFLVTILFYTIILAYMLIRLKYLVTRSATTVTQSLATEFFSINDTKVFNDIGFNIAWTMEDNRNVSKSYDDPNFVIW